MNKFLKNRKSCYLTLPPACCILFDSSYQILQTVKFQKTHIRWKYPILWKFVKFIWNFSRQCKQLRKLFRFSWGQKLRVDCFGLSKKWFDQIFSRRRFIEQIETISGHMKTFMIFYPVAIDFESNVLIRSDISFYINSVTLSFESSFIQKASDNSLSFARKICINQWKAKVLMMDVNL